MLDIWKLNIFDNIKQRLQDAAMNMIYLERNGEKIDSQLIIEVKQSFSKFIFCNNSIYITFVILI